MIKVHTHINGDIVGYLCRERERERGSKVRKTEFLNSMTEYWSTDLLRSWIGRPSSRPILHEEKNREQEGVDRSTDPALQDLQKAEKFAWLTG